MVLGGSNARGGVHGETYFAGLDIIEAFAIVFSSCNWFLQIFWVRNRSVQVAIGSLGWSIINEFTSKICVGVSYLNQPQRFVVGTSYLRSPSFSETLGSDDKISIT